MSVGMVELDTQQARMVRVGTAAPLGLLPQRVGGRRPAWGAPC